jgi:hypothetical protein
MFGYVIAEIYELVLAAGTISESFRYLQGPVDTGL